jgi:photosystem II stability/assembly factor-like uncharacterized protein
MRLRDHTFSFILILSAALAAPAFAQVEIARLDAMAARSIGPSGMSGRIGAVDFVDANPNIIYVGAATGGLWKTTNGGVTWTPIMDSLPAASIGAVRVHQANPDVVWIGSGERGRRNSAGVGTGVYKTLDGGRTWTRVPGLNNTGAINEILIDPRDQDVVYVSALGNTWADSPDRGLYKTTDGGRTWTKILYVDERTGANDLIMDPSNPDHVIVSMWEHRRWPWFFKSGGPGSGLYTSYDGGGTWKKLTTDAGLPEGELGRIGLDFARGNPAVVYALVEAERSQVLRSDDGGNTWTTVNRERGINGRPFYYGQLRVDPTNENHVWIVESRINHSIDGGETFETLLGFREVHVDHHAFRVHPDGKFIVDGNDGGVYLSYDGGSTWRFIENLPLAQFYEISVDMDTPYHVMGGLQDNGSWIGPGVTWHSGGIRYYDWHEVGFGDGFDTFRHPENSRYGFATSQNAGIVRFDLETGERKSIRPLDPDTTDLRFNWNPAIMIDPFDGGLYLGSQFVHKSMDMGDTWTTLSPDLTTNDPEKQTYLESGGLTYDVTGAEFHTTLLNIAPSPVQRGVIWTTSDDGLIHVTRDSGRTWTNVTRNVRGVPESTWIPEIDPSRFDPATAYVVFDDHRRGNNAPYVYKTTNFGRTWTSLVTPDLEYFLHTIEEDPVNPNVLYLGSEFGLYVSLNGGQRWHLWRHGVPRVPVQALVVHPREHDLVIATHGRAAYILDDVRPLRALADDPGIAHRSLHLFEIPATIQYQEAQAPGIRFTGYDMFLGENRPYGALLSYWVRADGRTGEPESGSAGERERGSGDSVRATIQVLDSNGEVVRTFEGPAEAGLNRTAWDLELDGPRRPEGAPGGGGGPFGPSGPDALPGTYSIRVIVGSDTSSAREVAVQPDPRLPYTLADRRAKLAALQGVMRNQEIAFEAMDRLRRAKTAIDEVLERLREKSDGTSRALRTAGDSLKAQLDSARAKFTTVREVQGIYRVPNLVTRLLGQAYGQFASSWAAPTATELARAQRAEARLREALEVANPALEAVAAYRQPVLAAAVEVFEGVEPITMQWRPEP